MINYTNEEIHFNGCPGCAYANHEFTIPCGMAYEDDDFTLSQDWELPIPAFFIISPKRHVSRLNELSKFERNKMFDIVNETIEILKKENIVDTFNIIMEEKENRHFHIWIMPRQEWMMEISPDIIGNIREIFQYAKDNFRKEEIYQEIKRITHILREEIEKKNTIIKEKR